HQGNRLPDFDISFPVYATVHPDGVALRCLRQCLLDGRYGMRWTNLNGSGIRDAAYHQANTHTKNNVVKPKHQQSPVISKGLPTLAPLRHGSPAPVPDLPGSQTLRRRHAWDFSTTHF